MECGVRSQHVASLLEGLPFQDYADSSLFLFKSTHAESSDVRRSRLVKSHDLSTDTVCGCLKLMSWSRKVWYSKPPQLHVHQSRTFRQGNALLFAVHPPSRPETLKALSPGASKPNGTHETPTLTPNVLNPKP